MRVEIRAKSWLVSLEKGGGGKGWLRTTSLFLASTFQLLCTAILPVCQGWMCGLSGAIGLQSFDAQWPHAPVGCSASYSGFAAHTFVAQVQGTHDNCQPLACFGRTATASTSFQLKEGSVCLFLGACLCLQVTSPACVHSMAQERIA